MTIEGADGKEKRVELFVGESSSAEEDERTEKRDGGGCAIEVGCVDSETDRRLCYPSRTSRVSLFCFSGSLSRASRLALRPQHDKSRGQSTTYSQSPPMNSPIVSPVPRPAEFQAHIYNSFLQGRTSDVALRIRGSWDATYKFHRVVLIQAVGTLSLLSL